MDTSHPTPGQRGAFKRIVLAWCNQPRTRVELEAQFGPQGLTCLANMALRREVRRVPGSSPAAYIDRRYARQLQASVSRP